MATQIVEQRTLDQSRALAAQIRSKSAASYLDKAAAEKKQRLTAVNEQLGPIGDVITLVANQQPGEATSILNELLSARVSDALEAQKQQIAQTLFAPSADPLQEEHESVEDFVKRGGKIKQAAPRKSYSAPKAQKIKVPFRMGKAVKEEVEQLDEAPTRKHFQQVADLIKSHPDATKRRELAAHHSGIFKTQNPRFDHKRFYAAANAGEPGV